MFSNLMGVPRLLDVIRAHYWTTPGQDSEKLPAGEGRLSEAELMEIRRGLLNITRVLMQHSILHGTWRSERSWGDIQVVFVLPSFLICSSLFPGAHFHMFDIRPDLSYILLVSHPRTIVISRNLETWQFVTQVVYSLNLDSVLAFFSNTRLILAMIFAAFTLHIWQMHEFNLIYRECT